VRFEGAVMYREPRTRTLIVSDGTKSVLVDQVQPAELARGAKVYVDGYSAYENYTVVVVKARLTIRPGSWEPQPVRVTQKEVFSGKYEHQFVTLPVRLESFRPLVFDKVRVVLKLDDKSVMGIVLRDTTGRIEKYLRTDLLVQAIPTIRRTLDGRVDSISLLIDSAQDFKPVGSTGSGSNQAPLPTADRSLPELQTITAIKNLSAKEAERRYPVRIKAVAIASMPSRAIVMLHDGKQGIYVFPIPGIMDWLKPGEYVEVEGHTDPGGFAPSIVPSVVRRLGNAPYPEPTVLDASAPLSNTLDNAWVEATGAVRSVRLNEWGTPVLSIVMRQWVFDAEVLEKHSIEGIQALQDRILSVRGVWSPLYGSRSELRGFKLFVPELSVLEVVGSVPAPAEPKMISHLRGFGGVTDAGQKVRVTGVVTASRSTGHVWVEDASGAVEVHLRRDVQRIPKAGEFVQASGYLPQDSVRFVLDEGEWAPVPAAGQSIEPARADGEICASGDLDGRLMRTQAYLTNTARSLGDAVMTAQSGRTTFHAILEAPSRDAMPAEIRPGSLVEFTGVCKVHWNSERQPPQAEEMQMVLRSADDVSVVAAASWWTRENTFRVLAVVSLVSAIVSAWVVLLRRRVSIQTEALRKQLEREADLKEQLEQARRLESIGRLAGGVAHDFNNLLTVILGYADDVKRSDSLTADDRESVEQVEQAGHRAAELTRQLLAFSRRQTLQPKVVNISEEIRRAQPLLKRVIDESVQLDLRLKEDVPAIKVDPGQLNQVLINLVANARDAMPAGGRLTIEVSEVLMEEESARRRQIEPGRHVRLTISDTGFGMTEETKARLFEPFFTTKGLGKGTGLGLATVYGIVKQSGGHIWVYSEPGHGTTFKLQFPATTESQPAPQPKAHVNYSVRAKTILLVEDRDDVRHLTSRLLTESGFQVVEAESGERAIEIVKSGNYTFDLLLVDAVLTGINGRQTVEAIQQIQRTARVLFMSGYTENVIMTRGQLKPGFQLLEKPFTREQLMQHIDEVLSAPTVQALQG
jgi:signal transduction histidine kinase/ActR/RegA family two-component response regulator